MNTSNPLTKKLSFPLFFAFLISSCLNNSPAHNITLCGYELSEQEYARLQMKIEKQQSAYHADTLGNIYAQLNDTIRSAMPDSVEFEVFLTLLNSNEVGVDVFVPRNKAFFNRIACAVMSSQFSTHMPKQRYLCVYSYPDNEEEEFPLELAIKRTQ